MFDLRAALLTAIPALSITHVDTTVDYRSTEQALQDVQSVSFTGAAILLGDWRAESIPWTYGWNQVRNEFEVIVACKSADAKAAFDDLQRSLRVGIERNGLAPMWRWTRLKDVSETRKAGTTGIHYQIATFEVFAIEESGAYANTQTSYTRPSLTGLTVSTDTIDGVNDLTITATVTAGSYTLTKCHFMIYRVTTQEYGFYGADSTITGGTASYTWTAPDPRNIDESAGTYNYRALAIVVDAEGLSYSDEISLTITRS